MSKNLITIPKGLHGADVDPLVARRKKISEMIRNNDDVPISPTGELLEKNTLDETKSSGFTTPKGVHGADSVIGKLFCW